MLVFKPEIFRGQIVCLSTYQNQFWPPSINLCVCLLSDTCLCIDKYTRHQVEIWRYYNTTWIEPTVVINNQPWGIMYWLVFKHPMHSLLYKVNYIPVFARFFELLLFTRNANNVRNQVHMILNIHIISWITNNMMFHVEIYGLKWVELVSLNAAHACS